MQQGKGRDIDVMGIVLPNDWDEQDQLVEVVLYGNDESEHVLMGSESMHLLKLLHCRVRARGREWVHNGRRYLDVTSFEVLGTGTDSGYDLDGPFTSSTPHAE